MVTRRGFLMAGALLAQSPAVLAQVAEGRQQMTDYPEGVIAPFVWGERPIPVSGSGSPGTQSVDAVVIEAMRQNGIVGCGVCLVQKDRIVYEKGFGYAELPNVPFLATTATRCGSLAKAVTALCALLLFDQGKLDLDAPILPLLSKGLNVRYSGGQPWFAHSGMTNHCGGIIGHSAGYQFVGVSNWNYAQNPYVDSMLDRALTAAVAKLGP